MTSGLKTKLKVFRKQSFSTLLDFKNHGYDFGSSHLLTSEPHTAPQLEPLQFEPDNKFKPCVIDIQSVQLLSDLVVLVMGATGGGKSTIINIIVGEGKNIIPINEGLDPSYDYSVVRVSTPKGTVCFIEVPETKETQFPALYQRYNVIGIIFIHKVIDTRIAGELFRDLEEVKRVCRDDPFLSSHIVCVTSHWSSDNCDDQQELEVEELLKTSDDGWGREVRDGDLEFRRFQLSKPDEVRSILDHFFFRLERPSEVSSMECDDEELWTALDWKIIVTMGMTGAGKSNFISRARNTLQDDIIDIGSLDSQTNNIQAYKIHINGHKLILVDTPGFDDSHRSDLVILRVIANWLETTFRRKVLLDGVLYFHRITDNRMSGSAVSNIKIFQGLVGKGLVSRNVKFVTTMWEYDTRGEGWKREDELKKNPEYWGKMVNDGACVVRFLNSHESAKEILKSFRTGWHTQQALQLQVELVKQHRRLNETKAGQMLYGKLGELLTQHQLLLEEKRSDPGYQFSEDPNYRKLMDDLKGVRDSMKELHIGFGGRLHLLFTRWK